MALDRYIGHILDDYLRGLIADDPFHTYEVGEYYPHMLGFCPRKGYYEYVYGPRLSDSGVRYVNLGITLHDFILRGFAQRGYQVEVPFEFRISPDAVIRGRIDALSPDHVFELKTTTKHGIPKDEPKPYHVAQVSLYMKATGRKRAYILYVAREDLSRKIFEVPYKEENAQKAIRTALLIHQGLKTHTPPPKEPVAPWECKSCPFRDICQRDG